MLSLARNFATNTWDLVAEMAPYLLFGFAVAGLLHLLIRPEWVRRLLGKPGIGGVARASLVGVPMPLCSCSVIPVAASLRRSGASKGATASFLSSTPQTGVDSILATFALLGELFTTVRVGVAFLCGLVSGILVDLFASRKKHDTEPAEPTNTGKDSCCHDANNTADPEAEPRSFKGAVRYGLVTLPADLANALIVGLLLAGLITTLLPQDLFTGNLSGGWLAFLLATAISLPLYVCATGSIPMAYALMAAGLSPGAALVFLIVGPATNTATVVTVWKMLGRTATLTYLASLIVISWLAGWIFNASLSRELVDDGKHAHEGMGELALWQHGSGIALVTLLAIAIWITRRSSTEESDEASCCHS